MNKKKDSKREYSNFENFVNDINFNSLHCPIMDYFS